MCVQIVATVCGGMANALFRLWQCDLWVFAQKFRLKADSCHAMQLGNLQWEPATVLKLTFSNNKRKIAENKHEAAHLTWRTDNFH